jgi:hypothetical protein
MDPLAVVRNLQAVLLFNNAALPDAGFEFDLMPQKCLSECNQCHPCPALPELQARALKPTSATSNALMLGTNVLHGIDQAVQDVVDAVMAAQEVAAGGPAGLIRLSQAAQPVLQLDQLVSMAGGLGWDSAMHMCLGA